MTEELFDFEILKRSPSEIKVIGVGGGGSNAVNHMYRQGITDVDFVVCNTDLQALKASPVPIKIQLGPTVSEGRGAGNKPERGRQAAIESLDQISQVLSNNTKMIFITAGMGGGTGTGAAPIIAQEAREMGILTVAIVTLPFRFEGKKRLDQAIEGIKEIKQFVDSLLVIDNEKFWDGYGNYGLSAAFAKADDVLTIAAKGIAEIITIPGRVNIDFEDVYTVMKDSNVALMGSAVASGDNRALDAVKEALNSPLLNNNDIRGAQNILLNISSGTQEVTIDEIGQITKYLTEAAGSGLKSDVIWGENIDLSLEDKIKVIVTATGFSCDSIPELYQKVEGESEFDSQSSKNKNDTQRPQYQQTPQTKQPQNTSPANNYQQVQQTQQFQQTQQAQQTQPVQQYQQTQQRPVTNSVNQPIQTNQQNITNPDVAQRSVNPLPTENQFNKIQLTEEISIIEDNSITENSENLTINYKPQYVSKNQNDNNFDSRGKSINYKNLEDIERIPAYERRNININK